MHLAKTLSYRELLFDLRLRDPLNQGQLLDQQAYCWLCE